MSFEIAYPYSHCRPQSEQYRGLGEAFSNSSSIVSLCMSQSKVFYILLDFSLTVKAATLIFISGCGSAISYAKEGKSGFIYNLVKS